MQVGLSWTQLITNWIQSIQVAALMSNLILLKITILRKNFMQKIKNNIYIF